MEFQTALRSSGFLERLRFYTISHDDYHKYFTGKANCGIFLAMNAPQVYYKVYYNMNDEKKLSDQIDAFRSKCL